MKPVITMIILKIQLCDITISF